jgi:hypothetical protein
VIVFFRNPIEDFFVLKDLEDPDEASAAPPAGAFARKDIR